MLSLVLLLTLGFVLAVRSDQTENDDAASSGDEDGAFPIALFVPIFMPVWVAAIAAKKKRDKGG